MMTPYSALKYSRPILWFVIVLLIFLTTADVVIVSQQRKLLKDSRQNNVRNELDLMGALVREALLKHDYGTVENFLVQWGKDHQDVLEIKAVAPNNFVLAEYRSPLPMKHFFHTQQKVSYEGEYLITLELVKDFSNMEKNLDALSFKLIGGSIIFISLLGFFLWHTVNLTAMKPLQNEIAERKKMEEALQESEERYRVLFESAGDAIFILDAEGGNIGKIVAVNKTAAEMHGYSIDELMHQDIRVFDTPESVHLAAPLIRRILGGEWVKGYEMTHRRKNGTVFPVEINAGLLELGNHRYILGFDRDITGRKSAEKKLEQYAAELKQSNEDVLSFAYIVSHDLRAPLVSIKGFIGELRFALKDIESVLTQCMPHLGEQGNAQLTAALRKDAPAAMNFISSSVTRMDNLINAILTLSRLGHRELKPEPVDMTEVVKSILSSLAHQIEQRKTVVTLGELPMITADKLSMEQIMGNLLDNALKYLDPVREGTIAVTTERIGEEIVFHISDNGCGIAQRDFHKVFEIFRRAGKQDVPGEGMGLAYVKTLVRKQSGRIWCESELGKGTTFSFTVPVSVPVSD